MTIIPSPKQQKLLELMLEDKKDRAIEIRDLCQAIEKCRVFWLDLYLLARKAEAIKETINSSNVGKTTTEFGKDKIIICLVHDNVIETFRIRLIPNVSPLCKIGEKVYQEEGRPKYYTKCNFCPGVRETGMICHDIFNIGDLKASVRCMKMIQWLHQTITSIKSYLGIEDD